MQTASMTPAPTPLAKLETLPLYKPGKPAEATMAEHGLEYAAKLSSNENPFGPFPSIIAAIERAARDINRYPDTNATALRLAIAAKIDRPVERVTIGAASSGVLLMTINAFAGPGDEVIYGWRSFEAYPIFTQQMGATGVGVALKGFDLDLDAIADRVGPATKVVLIANPNNPTGTAITEAQMTRFLDRVPTRVLVVLDEAYREFVRPGTAVDGVEAYSDRANVLVSRTLSKAYGLAGLRVGYAAAHPDVIVALDKVAAPFSVSSVAQAAAVAALAIGSELDDRLALLRRERDRVLEGVRRFGLDAPESQANLVWLASGSQTQALFGVLERHGVVARPFGDEGVRVSVGSVRDNDLFLGALATAVRELPLQEHWVSF